MRKKEGHPDRSGINRYGEQGILFDYYEDEFGMRHPREELEPSIDWSHDPRSESSRERHFHGSSRRKNMNQDNPRFENDDFSPYSRPGYHRKDHPGVSGKNAQGDDWINRDEYDTQRNFMGKGPKGYQRSDDRIYEEVCIALTDNPTLDASEIGVKVHEGIVTLEGKVKDRMEKRIAESISVEIPGVLDVRNEITLTH